MNQAGEYLRIFFISISIMLTFMYVVSLVYKLIIYRLSPNTREVLFIILAIALGWISMHVAVEFPDNARFDLRIIPLIVAPLFLRKGFNFLYIGFGIGLARLSLGMDYAGFIGAVNVFAMSGLCWAISLWVRRKQWSFSGKMIMIILGINCFNTLFIAVFGVIPGMTYLHDIAPITFLLSSLFATVFVYILRDFQREAHKQIRLVQSNELLLEQSQIAEERAGQLEDAKIKLEIANEQLIRTSRYKTEFLANMSHELRTPLNSILVLSQLMEENVNEQLSDEILQYAQIIHTSGKDLLNLINEVLDLSKIEAGRMEIEIVDMSIKDLTEFLTYTFQALALKKEIGFEIEISTEIPDLIQTDSQRLKQIMNNLLSNAFKFTSLGSVVLRINKVFINKDSLSLPWLAFSIKDTGIGISTEKHQLIFEEFQQADGTTARNFGGTGLGLSISSKFAELMGGFIKVESKEAEGSCFTLYLPWNEITS